MLMVIIDPGGNNVNGHPVLINLGLFISGLTVSVFAPLASMVDLFALRGLHRWRRGHLLPWLALYGFFLLLIASHAITGVVHQV